MTIQINIAEAKARLSALVEAALDGEEIILAKAGKPLVRIMPIEPQRQPLVGALSRAGRTTETQASVFDPEPEDAAEPHILPGS